MNKPFLPMTMKLYIVSFIDDKGNKEFSGVYSSLAKAKQAANDGLAYGYDEAEDHDVPFTEAPTGDKWSTDELDFNAEIEQVELDN